MTLVLLLLVLALFFALVNMAAWWLGIDIAGVGGIGDDPADASHVSHEGEAHGHAGGQAALAHAPAHATPVRGAAHGHASHGPSGH